MRQYWTPTYVMVPDERRDNKIMQKAKYTDAELADAALDLYGEPTIYENNEE